MGGLGEKLDENCPAVKNMEKFDKNPGAPVQILYHPKLTLRETAGEESCFVFNPSSPKGSPFDE